MRRLLGLAFVALLYADDPAMIKRDGKDAAAIQKLIIHQQIDNAKIGIILSRYAQTHNCPTGKAGLNGMGMIQCEIKPIPELPPGTTNQRGLAGSTPQSRNP